MILARARFVGPFGLVALLSLSVLLAPVGCGRSSQPDAPGATATTAATDDDPAPAKGKGKGKGKAKGADEEPQSAGGSPSGGDDICPLFPVRTVEGIFGGSFAPAKMKFGHVCRYDTAGGSYASVANQLGALELYTQLYKHARPVDGYGEKAIFSDNRDSGPGRWELVIQKKGDLVGYDFHAKDGEHPSDDEVLAKLKKLADATLDGL